MNLSETICRLRAERGLSQGDLADALDVSRQSISKKPFSPTTKNIALIAVGWFARFLLPQLTRFFPLRTLTSFLFDWAMLPLTAVMAVLTVRLIRSWRLAKHENH